MNFYTTTAAVSGRLMVSLLLAALLGGAHSAVAKDSATYGSIEPFRLGMHCSEVQALMTEMFAGRMKGFELYRSNKVENRYWGEANCSEGSVRWRFEPNEHGFMFSISDDESGKHGNYHWVVFDPRGYAIRIELNRVWQPSDSKPSIGTLRRSLEAKYGSPAVMVVGDAKIDNGYTSMFWGSKTQADINAGRTKRVIKTNPKIPLNEEPCFKKNRGDSKATVQCMLESLEGDPLALARKKESGVALEARIQPGDGIGAGVYRFTLESEDVEAYARFVKAEEASRGKSQRQREERAVPKF